MMCVDCEREVIAGLREHVMELQAEKDRLNDELRKALADKIRYRELYREVTADRAVLLRELKIAKDVMQQSDDEEAKDRERMKRELTDAQATIDSLRKRLYKSLHDGDVLRSKAATLDNLANVLRSMVD